MLRAFDGIVKTYLDDLFRRFLEPEHHTEIILISFRKYIVYRSNLILSEFLFLSSLSWNEHFANFMMQINVKNNNMLAMIQTVMEQFKNFEVSISNKLSNTLQVE